MCKWINLIIIYLCIIIISIKNFTLRVTHEYIYEGDFPIEICDYLKENFEMEDIRVYNHFNFGAYLEFKEIPNFIDGRSGIYYQKYGETSIIDDFLKVSIEGKYEETFSKYDITHVILYNGEKANEKIYNDDNYKILYQTDQFSLYERKN